ncbi:hypothetical protein QW060_07455 [Myroides ceti]|uniref:Uncharacterized protein n=1 Tax=Paenimyroides ceti TaxID=395087 RepID=A0ABT8CR31_9FLAO|nr:hypothetical protein [Paenimyroides ceti]MDN3706969.1 hypothetical protein [Paenimyroides ceti]
MTTLLKSVSMLLQIFNTYSTYMTTYYFILGGNKKKWKICSEN